MDLKFVTPSTFLVQVVLIIIILWILNKFLFKPYLNYIDEWEEKHKKLEDDYNHIDQLIKNANEQKQQILAEAKDKGNELINEAKSLAEQKKEGIILEANKVANAIKEASQKEMERQKLSMLKEVKFKAIDIALKLNGKLFDKEKVSKDYLEKAIDSIS